MLPINIRIKDLTTDQINDLIYEQYLVNQFPDPHERILALLDKRAMTKDELLNSVTKYQHPLDPTPFQ